MPVVSPVSHFRGGIEPPSPKKDTLMSQIAYQIAELNRLLGQFSDRFSDEERRQIKVFCDLYDDKINNNSSQFWTTIGFGVLSGVCQIAGGFVEDPIKGILQGAGTFSSKGSEIAQLFLKGPEMAADRDLSLVQKDRDSVMGQRAAFNRAMADFLTALQATQNTTR